MTTPELITLQELQKRINVSRDEAYQVSWNQTYIKNGIVIDLNKGKKNRRNRQIRINWNKYSEFVGII